VTIIAPIEAIPAAAPNVGLLSSARRPNDGARWEGGFAWRPERCITTQGFSPCTNPDAPDFIADGGGVQYHVPVGYRVRDYCTTIGGQLDEDRVRRQAEAVASYEIAHELWTGEISAADPVTIEGSPFVNPHLASTDATTVVGTGTFAERLGQLEEAARVAAKGQQVFLHVPIHLITPVANLLIRRGEALYTALDSVVVADAGYIGTSPAGAAGEWMYATGPVAVRMTPVEVEFDPAETIDRRINRQEIWADRLFAAYFDPCVHLAMDTA
jgi:hypothetical protein